MRAILAILTTDLRQLVRSRRAILVAVLLPILAWPVMLLITQRVGREQRERIEGTTYHWAVTGPEAEGVERLMTLAREAPPDDRQAGPIGAGLERLDPPADYRAAIAAGDLHVLIETLPAGTPVEAPARTSGPSGGRSLGDGDAAGAPAMPARDLLETAHEQAAAALDPAASGPADDGAAVATEREVPSAVPVLRLHYRADNDLSREAADRIERTLRRGNEVRRERLLLERGFPARPDQLGAIEIRDLATREQSSGLQLGRFISALLVTLLFAGGSVVASDSLAGEKERGTLETLLTTAVSRHEIVVAKQLSILVVALGMTALQLIAIWTYTGSGLLSLPSSVHFQLGPARIALLFVLYLPVAALLASALLLASAYAKTYKEAQLYFLPVLLLGIAPTLAPVLPGTTLRSALLLLPIANVSLAVKEMLAGAPDWPMTAVAWAVTATAAVGLAAAAARLLTRESLISSVQAEPSAALGGEAAFRRDVLRFVASAWALVLLASLAMEQGPNLLERQLAFNMSVLLGLALLLLRRYRLSVRDTLSLRAPAPEAWLAVIVGAPSALVSGLLLARAASTFLPVPEEALRQLVEQLLPEGTPTWRLALLIVVLPALIEEIFFRGVLLHGLAGQRTALRVALSALVFGAFHVSFYRLLPTSFLGAILALVVLWTGSIFPSMAWHAANNALAAFVFDQIESLPTWAAIACWPGLALALWLLWRARRRRPAAAA